MRICIIPFAVLKFVVLLGFALSLPAGARAETTSAVPKTAVVPATVQSFFTHHCISCHGDDDTKGGVRLDTLPADFADPQTAGVWAEVFDQISTGQMPPKKKPRPPETELRQTTEWIRQCITSTQLAARKADGRVVLRRLNRAEYGNSVRDLLGAQADLEELLPEDTASMGFDNVAAALSTSSVLMERYLEAADTALDAAIQSGPKPETKTWNVAYGVVTTNPNDFRLKGGVESLKDGTWVIYNSGDGPVNCDRFKAPVEGDYHFKLKIFAHRSDKPLVMSVVAGSFDSKNPKRRTVGFYDAPPANAGESAAFRTIEFTEHLPKNGTFHVIAYRLGRRTLDKPELVTAYTGPGVAIASVNAEGPLYASWPTPGQKSLLGDVDLKNGSVADAETILLRFASRAFRRPATVEDIAPMLEMVRTKLVAKVPFESALRAGLKGVLCSPGFLFLCERPGKLDAYAIASRLSYFLWSSTPDDELLRLAANGSLTKPDILRAQTERLLKDPKAERFVTNFTGQWLNLRQIDFTTPDKKLYPEFDEILQWSMPEETRGFFRELLTKDLGIENVIDSDFAMLNSRLGELYGISGVNGLELRRVALPPGTHRGGILGQAAVLKVTANGTTTSPVIRGAWVMRNILGRPPKAPPPNVPAIEPDIRGAKTIREQLDKHRSLGQCASCHAKMDPPGVALESFDVIGGWRETYRTVGGKGKAQTVMIDGRKSAIGIGPKVDPADHFADGRAFEGYDQFKQLLLADKDQVAKCLAEKLLVYATGAGLDFADRPAVDALLARAKQKQYGLRTLVHEVVQSEVFLNK